MIYVSIDTETTGLDDEKHQIIEFAAIIEDTTKQLSLEEIPKFTAIVEHETYVGSAFAINMNQRIFEILAKKNTITDIAERHDYIKEHNIIDHEFLAQYFQQFLQEHIYDRLKPIKINAAGKNFAGFDKRFITKVPHMNDVVKFSHKVLDPAPLFTDFVNDVELPSLDECLVRAGVSAGVTHVALDDAWDVIRVNRTQYDRQSEYLSENRIDK